MNSLHKIMIFREIEIKINGSCYKSSLKNIILSNINRLYGQNMLNWSFLCEKTESGDDR